MNFRDAAGAGGLRGQVGEPLSGRLISGPFPWADFVGLRRPPWTWQGPLIDQHGAFIQLR